MGEGEETTGEGGQKDCKWEVELDLDWEEGEEEGVMLPLTALPLLLVPLALAPPFTSP